MKQISILLLLIFSVRILSAQTEGISINASGDDPDPSAMLDIQSDSKGLLIPRMDSINRKAIANPAQGLMVYDSTTQSFWFYDSVWNEVPSGTIPLVRDTDGDTQIQVEESPDEDIIRFDVNNREVVRIDSSSFFANPGLDAAVTRNVNIDFGAFGYSNNHQPGWQSFTITKDGMLALFKMKFGPNPLSGYTFTINKGTGTGGAVLASATLNSPSQGWNSILVLDEVFLEKDSIYTIAFNNYNNITFAWLDVYAGGQANDNPNNDYHLKVFINEHIPMLNGVEGNTGIGTMTPEERLHVLGKFKYEDGTQQDGYVLTSDADGVASWQASGSGTIQGTDSNTYNIRAASPNLPQGNTRGEYSVDLQTSRSSNAYVASGISSVIGGGSSNWASGSTTTISGGDSNFASGIGATIGGGELNEALGDYGSVMGGGDNYADGDYSSVIGGYKNQATGRYSMAGGLWSFAPSYGETVLGMYAESYVYVSDQVFNPLDRLFVIGNGTGYSNRSNALTILKNGNLGLGTTTPENTLHLVGQLRYEDGNQIAGHVLTSDANGVASWQAPVGDDLGNHTATQNIALGPHFLSGDGDTEGVFVASNGKVGIGTPNPAQKLSVSGSAQISGNLAVGITTPVRGKVEIVGSLDHQLASYGFLNSDGNPGTFTPVSPAPYSLYATNRIAASHFNAHSDIRIKQIQGISNGEADLATLMRINITDYTMLDSISHGKGLNKKVIAQQVAEVYPQAVTTNLTEVVPDIYQRADVQDGWIMLATDLQVGERLKLITEQSNNIYEVIEVESTRFKVNLSSFDEARDKSHLSALPTHLFVYGREVNDFHTVDYEALSMLNISATQEQQRRIEDLETEVSALRNLAKRLESLEARLEQNDPNKKASK